MNALEKFIEENALDEDEVMDLLWDAGMISDLCVRAADVHVIPFVRERLL